MQPQRPRQRWLKRLIAPLVIVALFVALAGHIQAIADYVRLYGYTAPADVATLAGQDTMTPYARKLFYVNHPLIADKSSFASYCGSQDSATIILGCYHPVDRGIYIDHITDARLNGVEQVTAAHEMLHAAYDRLSASDKKTIDDELQNFYDNDEHDQRIRDTIAAYQKSEPGDVVNEMHSIFGTEVAQLTPELESYYKRYFTDRAAVAHFASTYQDEFTSREDQVKADDTKLKSLKAEIDTDSTSLNQQQTGINTLRQQMEDEKSAGNISAYNANVPVYNGKIDTYNALVHTVQADIATYNQLVDERNSLVIEVRQLTQSINSQPTPIGQ